MPYKFSFFDNQIDYKPYFQCKLMCTQCQGRTLTGARCSKSSCIGSPFCWLHLLKERNLKIQESTIVGAGKGLFAFSAKRKRHENDIVLFRKGDFIVEYGGERVTKALLDKRYGDYTAPYGLELIQTKDIYEDGACQRGVGAIANHTNQKNANSKYSYSKRQKKGILVATRYIKHGDEILINYGNDYRFDEPTRHSTKLTR